MSPHPSETPGAHAHSHTRAHLPSIGAEGEAALPAAHGCRRRCPLPAQRGVTLATLPRPGPCAPRAARQLRRRKGRLFELGRGFLRAPPPRRHPAPSAEPPPVLPGERRQVCPAGKVGSAWPPVKSRANAETMHSPSASGPPVLPPGPTPSFRSENAVPSCCARQGPFRTLHDSRVESSKERGVLGIHLALMHSPLETNRVES